MKKSGILFFTKEPTLTFTQIDKLSDILIALGQLSLASMVLPFIIPGLDQARIPVIIFGLLATFVSWITSILIIRKSE